MVVSESTIKEEVHRFVQKFASDHYCLELMVFFGRHPHARFSHRAVIHAFSGSRACAEQVLERLTESGILRNQIENGVPVYSLCESEPLRTALLRLANLDHLQRRRVLR